MALHADGYYYFEGNYQGMTSEYMEVNVSYITKILRGYGWTDNAIAGLCGNMQTESWFDPNAWEGNNVGTASKGYGLVQWTPSTKYRNWVDENGYGEYYSIDNQIKRLEWERANGEQYYKTSAYPETFTEFINSTESPYYLACAFAFNYERSHTALYGTEAEKEALRQQRGGQAERWYEFITGVEPDDPDTPTPDPGTTTKKDGFIMWALKMGVFRHVV